MLAHGLIGAPDKAELAELLRTGKPNGEIAQWLGRAVPGIVETMELETGDTADYRTTSEGIELEVLDADEKRLAMLFFRWDEVVPPAARAVCPSAGRLWAGAGRTSYYR